jgi:TATA-box binding protein (TBP) (component of TFIID and TFIIIB)
LKRYHQSVLKAACEGKLVPTEAELARAEGRAKNVDKVNEIVERVLSILKEAGINAALKTVKINNIVLMDKIELNQSLRISRARIFLKGLY